MEQNSDPLVRLAIDVHLSTKNLFRERCAKLDVPMSHQFRLLLEQDLESAGCYDVEEDAETAA